MLTVPISLIVSGVAAFILLRSWRRVGVWRAYHTLLSAFAAQGVIMALAQHYGVRALAPLQPVTAAAIPALAWLAFRSTFFEPTRLPRDGVHAIGPAVVALCVGFAPSAIDILLPVVFIGYAAAILLALRRNEGDLPLAPLSTGLLPANVWRVLAISLIVSAFSDVLVAGAFALDRPDLRSPIVSAFIALHLLMICVLSLYHENDAPADHAAVGAPNLSAPPAAEEPGPAASDPEEDDALIARLDALLADEALFLEPDLTLSRLARRLKTPVKQVSAAINRRTGENVSRYVNGYRIRRACALLSAGTSVSDAIYASGFNTKSNFNREFRRITGMAPTEWLAAQGEPSATS